MNLPRSSRGRPYEHACRLRVRVIPTATTESPVPFFLSSSRCGRLFSSLPCEHGLSGLEAADMELRNADAELYRFRFVQYGAPCLVCPFSWACGALSRVASVNDVTGKTMVFKGAVLGHWSPPLVCGAGIF